MTILNKFQLLEINVISAQDLEVVSRKMKTYATARVNPSRKLTSSIDKKGHNNPTWNEKFVFRVDDEFLYQDISSVMIEIYAINWLRDTIVGSVNVLVGNLIPPPTMPCHRNNNNLGMRFIALQVRRPSGRPQGILNIGVALLDSSMRSMPLYSQLSASAVGYRDLMDEDHLHNHQQNQNSNDDDDDGDKEKKNNNNGDKEKQKNAPVVKPILRRTKSERSERVTFENTSIANSSILAIAHKKGPHTKDSSILSISDVGNPFMKKTTKASSVISGYELSDKPKQRKGKKGKSGSVLSDSVVSKDSRASRQFFKNEEVKPKEDEVKHEEKTEVPMPMPTPLPEPEPEPMLEVPVTKAVHEHSANKVIDERGFSKSPEVVVELRPPPPPPVKENSMKSIAKPTQKFIPYEFGASKANPKYAHKAFMKPTSSVWSDSEVGPSPSEVAACMAEKRYPLDDGQSSVLDGWSLDESVEGLRSKLDRWRTELPPIYDRGGFSSSYQSSVQRPRRHSESGSGGESGQFSCFGNFFGYECQCVCGKPPGKKHSSRYRSSPSVGSRSFL